MSPSNLDRFAKESSNKLPVVIRETTSSSCPTIKHEMTDEDLSNYSKDRMKKDNHNKSRLTVRHVNSMA